MSPTPRAQRTEQQCRPLALVGTTASGKSAVAMALARELDDVELVSVDSMQVYRGMDIGTAKPTAADRAAVPHHLLDLVEPDEEFDVHSFQVAVSAALTDITSRGKRPVLVGGTGLYLRAVVDDLSLPGRFPEVADELALEPDITVLHQRLAVLDPLAARRMDPSNRRRVVRALEVTLGSGRPFSSYGPGLETYPATHFDLVGLWLPRPVVAARIEQRFGHQLAAGFVDEVRQLAGRPHPMSRSAGQALGYRELSAHVRGECSLDDAVDLAVRRTRHFARRQRVWFRRDPRITWLGAAEDPLVVLPTLLGHIGA